jgi:hypothetical protein
MRWPCSCHISNKHDRWVHADSIWFHDEFYRTSLCSGLVCDKFDKTSLNYGLDIQQYRYVIKMTIIIDHAFYKFSETVTKNLSCINTFLIVHVCCNNYMLYNCWTICVALIYMAQMYLLFVDRLYLLWIGIWYYCTQLAKLMLKFLIFLGHFLVFL